MSAEGEKRRILEALGSIETLKNVSRSWPRQQAALPCAVVTLAGERRADERDGAEYLTETEYYVRCFARTGTEADELAPKIRREMAENAKALCPVGSGELKGSIAPQVMGPSGSVAAGAGHAAYVELGTWKKEARPFLLPAFAMTKEKAAEEIAREIRNAIREG